MIGIQAQILRSFELQRVFAIKHLHMRGTAFVIDFAEDQYLVTAKHIFKDSIKSSNQLVSIAIYHANQWKILNLVPLIYYIEEWDVIFFKLENFKLIDFENHYHDLSCSGVFISQDAFTLGYPLDITLDGKNINNGFPLPLVKKCTLSGIDITGGFPLIYLDGHNNKGLSGAPVFCLNIESGNFNLIGVVSSYLSIDNDSTENSGLFIAHGLLPIEQWLGVPGLLQHINRF